MKRILLIAGVLCLWLATPAEAEMAAFVPLPQDDPLRASLMPQVERWRAAVAQGDMETLLSFSVASDHARMRDVFHLPHLPDWMQEYDVNGALRKRAGSASARPVLFKVFLNNTPLGEIGLCLREPGSDGTVPEAPPTRNEYCAPFWLLDGAWRVGYPMPIPPPVIYRRISPSNPQYPELADAVGRWAHAVAARDIPTLIAFAWPDAQEAVRKALANPASAVYRNLLENASPIRNLFPEAGAPFVLYNRGEPPDAPVKSFQACFYDPARADMAPYPDSRAAWDAIHAKDAQSPRPDDGTSDVYCHDFIDMSGWRANYEYEGVILSDPSTYQNEDDPN